MPIYAIRGILGPRTKSWTLGSGLEVRMRDGETVGLFLLAREEGMGFAEAAEFAGVAPPGPPRGGPPGCCRTPIAAGTTDGPAGSRCAAGTAW